MKICYFDCSAGAAGDMILASLLHAGFPMKALREGLSRLGIDDYSLRTPTVMRNGVAAKGLIVKQKDKNPALRVLPGIRKLIEGAHYPKRVTERSLEVFTRLAKAEAKVHRMALEKVHFHEIGAVDTIVDIVGTALALEYFGVDQVEASPLPMGHGEVRFSHGVLPLPAPATAELLKGVPVYGVDVQGETVTPTGAAILSTLATRFGQFPSMSTCHTGYGTGTREDKGSTNLLRSFIGEASAVDAQSSSVVLEANVDDMNPEQLPHLMEKLFQAGAQDVSFTATVMKKNRPGTIITVIGPKTKLQELSTCLLTESTTIGLRHWEVGRIVLDREPVKVKTRYGTVRIKIARLGQCVLNASPEYEDCRKLAEKKNVPLKKVYAEAQHAAVKQDLLK